MLHARLAKRLDFCDDGQAPNNRLFDHRENLVSKQVGPILAVAIFLLYKVSNIRYSHKAICSTMFITHTHTPLLRLSLNHGFYDILHGIVSQVKWCLRKKPKQPYLRRFSFGY